jgi:hypothetical protein
VRLSGAAAPRQNLYGCAMSTIQTSQQVLDRHFLEMRAGLLDLAAALDRIERSEGRAEVREDERLVKLREAIRILLSDGSDRAERIQLLFSDEYQSDWNR